MPLAEDMRKIVDHIVSSYEARIQDLGILFDTTHQILQSFQDSLLDTREERVKLNAELRENLARNRSLRKRDFDQMMESLLLIQAVREKEVRDLLNGYLNQQKEMSQALRHNLMKFKDSLTKGEAQRVRECQEMIKEILSEQETRRDGVTSRLKEFKKEQSVLTSKLKGLLAKGRELRITDLKLALEGFKTQYQERSARQEGRRREVGQLPDEFKKKRTEPLQHWGIMRNKLAQLS